MHQIYPDGNGTNSGDNGLIGILQRFISAGFHYHLFSNNVTIGTGTTLASLTEVTATGYAAVTVSSGAFTLVGLASHNGSVMASPIGFGTNSSGGSVNCYGYYVTDTSNTVLLAAANFDSAPVAVPNGSAFPLVVPVFGDFSQYTS
jgi:hypothetical protein